MAWHKLLLTLILGLIGSMRSVHAQSELREEANVHKSKSNRSILVVVGAPGEEEFGRAFRESAERWKRAFASDDLLMLDGTASNPMDQPNHLQQILDWISRPTADSALQERWLVFIGHGTHDRNASKFNLSGPDISAEVISKAISNVKARWLIIDASSSSGPFINALSGDNRVIITATKSGAEQNYSRFAEFLSQAITDPSTDLDHDESVSILEAFLAASNRVAQFYQNEGRLASEQALLDDNGDSRGTPAAFYRGARPVKAPANGLKLDGNLASRMLVSLFGGPDKRTDEQKSLADSLAVKIEEWRARKKDLPEQEYYDELERLFLKLAKTN
jgi:hypothetical protein